MENNLIKDIKPIRLKNGNLFYEELGLLYDCNEDKYVVLDNDACPIDPNPEPPSVEPEGPCSGEDCEDEDGGGNIIEPCPPEENENDCDLPLLNGGFKGDKRRIKYFPLTYENRMHADFGEMILDKNTGHIYIRNPKYVDAFNQENGEIDPCDAPDMFISPTKVFEYKLENGLKVIRDFRDNIEINRKLINNINDELVIVNNELHDINNQLDETNNRITNVYDELNLKITSSVEEIGDTIINLEENITQQLGDTTSELESTVDELKKEIEKNINTIENNISKHINDHNNPHKVTKAQVGLGNVPNFSKATVTEAKGGSADNKFMTPHTTKSAISKWESVSSVNGRKGSVKLDTRDNENIMIDTSKNYKFSDSPKDYPMGETITMLNYKEHKKIIDDWYKYASNHDLTWSKTIANYDTMVLHTTKTNVDGVITVNQVLTFISAYLTSDYEMEIPTGYSRIFTRGSMESGSKWGPVSRMLNIEDFNRINFILGSINIDVNGSSLSMNTPMVKTQQVTNGPILRNVHVGTSNPSNSAGKNGEIYIKYK